jgi:hypothetical protein
MNRVFKYENRYIKFYVVEHLEPGHYKQTKKQENYGKNRKFIVHVEDLITDVELNNIQVPL